MERTLFTNQHKIRQPNMGSWGRSACKNLAPQLRSSSVVLYRGIHVASRGRDRTRKDTGPKDQSAAWLCGKPEKGGFLAYLGTTSGFGTFSHCPTHSPVTCAALWYFYYARPMAGLWPVDLAWLKCGMYRPDPTERPCLSRCLGTAGPGRPQRIRADFVNRNHWEDLQIGITLIFNFK